MGNIENVFIYFFINLDTSFNNTLFYNYINYDKTPLLDVFLPIMKI